LMTYENARPWAKAIQQSTALGTMPPWHAAPGTPHAFANDRRLKPAELETLRAWASTGAKKGDAKDAPAPRTFTEGWNIAKPDVIVKPAKPYQIPASGTVEYTYYILPAYFDKDTWISEAELRPGARRQVHHIILYVRPPGSSWLKGAPANTYFVPESLKQREARAPQEKPFQWREFLCGYAPGYTGLQLRAGSAKMIPAGSDLVFELHYTTNGKPAEDISSIGMVFAKGEPTHRVITDGALSSRFRIPPGNPAYSFEAGVEMREDGTLISLNPHMHLRGRAFEYRATYPDGRSEVLLRVPKYDFNWQTTYEFAKPVPLPKGTRLEVTAWWDNSPNNPNNPDPSKTVTWGDQSWNEMLVGFYEMEFDRKIDPSALTRPIRVDAPQKPLPASDN
ncbi:MAG: thiol-disulfide isomerase, partial [Bryobacter sp.]|nr:thiol-disulfide isomerase [Bryobacter sp.]